MRGDQTPIPPYAEDVLAELVDSIGEDQPGIDESRAIGELLDEGFTRADAADALEVLEMRGYIYRVDSELRITE